MKNGFDYKEYINWCKKLEITIDDFQIWLKTFLLMQAERVVALAKPRTPVDTGFLRMSYNIGNESKVLKANKQGKYTNSSQNYNSAFSQQASIDDIQVVGNNLQVEISNSAEYASFIEYGHRSYEGKYMLTISVDIVQRQLPARFNKEWLQFIKSKGVF